MSRTSKSTPSAALLHKQTNTATEIAITATGTRTNFYGFLVEEPALSATTLYVLITDGADNIIMSFETSAKFGRDGQTFALKSSDGLKAKLSTSRASVIAPTVGATLHVWYSA